MPGAFRTLVVRAATNGSTFDDSGNSNRILAVVAVLLVIGVALLLFSYWYWRSTRPEPEALAPLELLGTRKLRKVSPEERRSALDQVRPARPDTSEPSEPSEPVLPVPPIDLAAAASRELPPIADLGEAPVPPSASPATSPAPDAPPPPPPVATPPDADASADSAERS